MLKKVYKLVASVSCIYRNDACFKRFNKIPVFEGSPSKIANAFFGNANPCFMVNTILSINSSGKIYSFSESEEAVLDLADGPLNSSAMGFNCVCEPLDSIDFCPPLGSGTSCL